MTKVFFTIKNEQEPRQIGKIKVKALQGGLKKVKEILSIMKEDESLREFLEYMSAAKPQEDNEAAAAEADSEFMKHLAGGFDVLLERVPDKVIELLAIIADVDVEIIQEQEIEVLFDVFDAVVAENDIPKLIERAKKSFFNVKGKFSRE